jgi:hypothetical protein
MAHSRPLAIDLFTGLHGWADGLVAEGFDVIGFDLEDMCAQFRHPRPPHVQLVLQDVLTLHGSQFRDATLIVASPPCQAYSYRAMPWKRAKALPPPDNTLFEACFRIQREACEAAGRHIPMVVENVRGAQKWVGRARWNYGSFYLWGDVPALMPFAGGTKVPGFRFDGRGSFQSASVSGLKGVGPAWDAENGCGAHGMKRWTNPAEGIKHHGSGDVWFDTGPASLPSASPRRKEASATIAKIPLPLSRHIAAVYAHSGHWATDSLAGERAA